MDLGLRISDCGVKMRQRVKGKKEGDRNQGRIVYSRWSTIHRRKKPEILISKTETNSKIKSKNSIREFLQISFPTFIKGTFLVPPVSPVFVYFH